MAHILFLIQISLLLFIFVNSEETNIINEVISNPIIMSERQNKILFALSKNCSESTYSKLLKSFLFLEQQTQNKFSGISYDVNSNFGSELDFNFTKSDKLYETYGKLWCSKDENCFEASRIDNVNSLVSNFVRYDQPCPEKVRKEFILIVSDVCVTSITKQFDDLTRCSMDYRSIWLLLPTEMDVQQCKKQVDKLEIFASIISNETINAAEIDKYSNMDVTYQATMATSKVNLLVMMEELFYPSYNYLEVKFNNVPLCEKGSMVGFFQYLTTNKPIQRVYTMTLPLNYENPMFIANNYKRLIKNAINETIHCTFVKKFLTQANFTQSNQEQWNVLFIEDPYPSCLGNFDLNWNNINRHLEIIVRSSKILENDYSKFITFANDSLNHLTFMDKDDGFAEFWNDTTVCRAEVPWREITENASIIVATDKPKNSSDVSIVKSGDEGSKLIWWIICGILLLFILFTLIIGGRYIYIRKSINKRMSSIRDKAAKITSITKIQHSKKSQKKLLHDQDLIIDTETVLGKGSNSVVYKAILKTTSTFNVFSASKIDIQAAAKVSTSFETSDANKFVNELNSLSLLKAHPNIIALKGWTLMGYLPVIVTEIAESNLLDLVKCLTSKDDDVKSIIQILWQISGALNYIAENKLIHRDVACRNVLLTDKNVAKLADFGLCCKTKKNGTFQDSKHKKFPIKWLSIEALTQCKFSEKSDVWAFGVLCFEAFTFGAIPYSNLSSSEMIEFLQNGKRLNKPENAPDCIYEIMLNCWEKEPNARATFKEIHNKIEQVLEYGYLPLDYDFKRKSFY